MTAPIASLLLIEDDPQIQRFLATALDAHGYALRIAGNGNEGLQLAALHQPDITIVDIGLPDISGLDVIRRLREWYAQPILVLSARDRENDKVAALDLGADDYLTKPFGIGELLARLRVMQRHRSGRDVKQDLARIELGDITLDLATRRVLRDGADIHLTPIEYQLLTTLARHRGKVLTHRQLLREVWGAAHTESPQYLRIYMRALRRKIEIDPAQPRLLLTEVGVGYRLADEPEPAVAPKIG
ncbi:MAG: response regulator [Dokdonella sp.]